MVTALIVLAAIATILGLVIEVTRILWRWWRKRKHQKKMQKLSQPKEIHQTSKKPESGKL